MINLINELFEKLVAQLRRILYTVHVKLQAFDNF